MSETVEIEIDDIHELMFKDLFNDIDGAPDLEKWAENTVENILYQSYQQQEGN
jgi:hypothetical protein